MPRGEPAEQVDYVGSLTRFHGPALLIGPCECAGCLDLIDTLPILGPGRPRSLGRYELRLPDGRTLLDVGAGSFRSTGVMVTSWLGWRHEPTNALRSRTTHARPWP